MTEEILFSIVIPVYNVEKYIERCLNSILEQSVRDYEVVLVDDGSKDRGGVICDEYAEKYPGVFTVIHKENGGSTSARRAGLAKACGKYIYIVDSDDFIRPDMLEKLQNIICEREPDMILFRYQRIHAETETLLSEQESAFPNGAVEKGAVFSKMLQSGAINPLWLKVCKRECYDLDRDYSPYYSIQVGEDLLQSLPLIANAQSFYYLDEPLYCYRINPESLTHNYKADQYKVLGVVHPALYDCMIKMGMDTPENVQGFYNRFGRVLWRNVELRILAGGNDLLADLQELREYDLVHRTLERLPQLHIAKTKKKGLRLFEKRQWKKLILYCKTGTIVRKILKH